MTLSNWNLLLEQMLAADVTQTAYRVWLAIARWTQGYPGNKGYVGRDLLREAAGREGKPLDARSFDRGVAELCEHGLLVVIPGKPGRGNRGHYKLVLRRGEKAAAPRPFEAVEKVATQRPLAKGLNRRSQTPETVAAQRPRRVRRVKNTGSTSETPSLVTRACDVYQGAGGSLKLTGVRGSLAGSVSALAKAGADKELILAGVKELARTKAFPGYLKQIVETLRDSGGACVWNGARNSLSTFQLRECGCNLCVEWAEGLEGVGQPVGATA